MGLPRRTHHDRPSNPSAGQDDRRSTCRYNVEADEQSWLGWWEGPTFVTTSARIMDLSLRGALLQVEKLPATDQSVWLCPPGTTPEWLEARLVQAKKKLLGPRHVRIAFRRLFPYETFKTLIYGRWSPSPAETPPYWVETGPEAEKDEW